MKNLSENKILAGLVALIFLFNLLPYLYRPFFDAPDKIYIGSFPIYTDQPTYLTEVVQGREGHWLIVDKYTNEPQQPTPVYIFYAFLGHISKILNVSTELVFLAARFIAGLFLIGCIIVAIKYFLKDKTSRLFAYLLAFFSSGLGWLYLGKHALDLWMPDFIPMVRFSHFPHMPLASGLFLLVIISLLRSFDEKRVLWAVLSGFFTFILNIILPFHSLLLYPLIIFYTIILVILEKNNVKKILTNTGVFLLISLPSFFYMLSVSQTNPIWKIVEKQNILPTPEVYEVFLGFGLISIISATGLYLLHKHKNKLFYLFLFWLTVPILAAFIPLQLLPIQRRFLEMGLFVPLAITAAAALSPLYRYLLKKKANLLGWKVPAIISLILLLFLMIFPGNCNNFRQFQKMVVERKDNPFLYVPKPIYDSILWLKNNAPEDSIVLSSFFNGLIIPYLSGQFVYVGHGPSTINLQEKMIKVNNFYLSIYNPRESYDFLKKENIKYVFYSEYEQKSQNFNPDSLFFLKKIYDTDGVRLYQFIK